MRRLRKALIALGATAAVVGGALAGAPTAQAASTWKTHDKNCETLTIDAQSIGSVCAEVQKRVTDAGSVNGYRSRVTVTPAEGQWMKPTTYSWSSDGALSQVCAGGCAQQTSAWTSTWSPVKTTAGTYTVRGGMGPGRYRHERYRHPQDQRPLRPVLHPPHRHLVHHRDPEHPRSRQPSGALRVRPGRIPSGDVKTIKASLFD